MNSDALWAEMCVVADSVEQDGLLGEVIAPFEAYHERSPNVSRFFFLRDTVDGQRCLRLFTSGPGDFADELHTLLAAAMPVRTRLVEGSPVPDGQAPFRGPHSSELICDFLTSVCPTVLTALRSVVTGETRRSNIAFDVLVAHLAAVASYLPSTGEDAVSQLVRRYRPVPVTFPSLRVHADGVMLMSKDPIGVREQVQQRYLEMAGPFRERLLALLKQIDGGPVVSTVAAAWYERAVASQESVQRELDGDDLVFSDFADDFPWEEVVGTSPMHQFAAATPAFLEYMSSDKGYLSMRAMMSMLYLALHNCLGTKLADRLFLCHVISSACEAEAGVRSEDLMFEFADAIGVL